MDYNTFRTGLRFKDVAQMLSLEQKRKREKGEYMFITRHTILGRWRELKQKMYWLEVEQFEDLQHEN